MSTEPLPHASFPADEPPDLEARRVALDPSRSFAVSAPAGSGKTGLLTQRVLTLLARCQEPEEVLAITFTRKAAGEMQDRILQALWQAHEEPEPDNPHARLTWQLAQAVLKRDDERQWHLLFSPQRLRILTIDSLCRAITRQLPLASQVGAQPDTLEDAEPAYQLAVRALFTILEDQDHPLNSDLIQLLRHLDNNLHTVENLLVALLARREQWLAMLFQARTEDARAYLESVLVRVNAEHLQQLTKALSGVASDLCLAADRAATNLTEEAPDNPIASLKGIAALPDCRTDALPQWHALASLLLTNDGQWRKAFNKHQGCPAGAAGKTLKGQFAAIVGELQERAPESMDLLHGVRQLPPDRYGDSQWQLLESLTRLLPYLAAQLKLVFRDLGATDYSEIAQAANLALGSEDDPSDIALKLDYRIQHILVDEFQDTSSPQLLLLEKLTAGWQPGDGRTLFIVGDGMQSCYSFRDANVGLFLDARQQGIGTVPLQALDLNVNFRSQAGIVQWVNDTFQPAFPARDDIGRGAVAYAPSVAFNQPLSEPAVRVYGSIYQDQNDADNENRHPDASPDIHVARLREAESVAHLVQQALTEQPDETVAVLVRSRPHLQLILPALARAGLRWQATDIDSLASRMAIMDLMSLTRALLNPDDRIAWLSILRAPWCGLDLHDLHCLVTTDLPELNPSPRGWPVIWQQVRLWRHIPGLSEAGGQALQRVLEVLEPAWRDRQRKPLRQWLEGVWLALGGPATLLEPADEDNIPSYFDLLEKHQQGGNLKDWGEFERALQRLYAAPRADADPRLQVMTLHKSKGLEFDTVIIPGLDRTPANEGHALLLWQEHLSESGQRELLLSPLAATGQEQDALYGFIRLEAERRRRHEATRLLYVGCTRAIKRLHLLASLKANSKSGEVEKPSARTLLSCIWPQVEAQLLAPPGPPVTSRMPSDAESPQEQTHILRLPPTWQAPRPESTTLLAAYRGREYDDEENRPEPETRAARLARHTGTVLHNQLQRLTETGIRQWSDAWADRQRPFWTQQLRALGWHGESLQVAINTIRLGLQRTLEDAEGLWLLDPSHADSQCELALHHWGENGARELVIDRTFVVDGVRWIIDYKSSTPAAGQSLEQFFAQEIDEYRGQLKRYCAAFQALGENRIVAALYFPLLESKPRLHQVLGDPTIPGGY